MFAPHASELPFVFARSEELSARENRLSHIMVQYWVQFARNGDPNGVPGLPVWPTYDHTDTSMGFDVSPQGVAPEAHVREAACSFWDQRA